MSTSPTSRWRQGEQQGQTTFAYPLTDKECPWWPGNCKCFVGKEYRERGHEVIYVGDGLSDTCPSRLTDFVFAREGLLSFCQSQGLPHRELTDFDVVVDYLEAQARGD